MKTKEIKRQEAEVRQETHNKLSSKEKIEKLNKKLGKGVGAKKERQKLHKLLEKKS